MRVSDRDARKGQVSGARELVLGQCYRDSSPVYYVTPPQASMPPPHLNLDNFTLLNEVRMCKKLCKTYVPNTLKYIRKVFLNQHFDKI